MKYALFVSSILWLSCTGTLTENQRKKIKDEMASSEIKKVTEAEITEAAFQYGRQVAAVIEKKDRTLSNKSFIDSLNLVFNIEIIPLQSSNNELRGVEKQILEAYKSDAQATDNIQKMGTDSLLYTKPIMREHPDGSTEFSKALGIRMTKKQVILTIN
jgi:hypothetical protein